jgi:hypothetical protein
MEGEIGPAMFEHACKLGHEGIVSRHRDRAYRAGRSANWIKIKDPASTANGARGRRLIVRSIHHEADASEASLLRMPFQCIPDFKIMPNTLTTITGNTSHRGSFLMDAIGPNTTTTTSRPIQNNAIPI